MSVPVVVFTDLAGHLARRLGPVLNARLPPARDTVVVATVEPVTRPARMVTFRRDGGPRRDVATEVARLGVNVWARTDAEVNALANLVRALLPTLVDGAPICRLDEASGLIDVAAASGQARRYFSIEVVARGEQRS